MVLSLDAPSAECGGAVSGTASWEGSTAEVSLRWTTSGDGTPDSGTAHTQSLSGSDGAFELKVPNEGPMTFAGKLISVRWEVVLRAGDSSESAEVTVLPRGGLTVWVRNVAPPPQT